MRSRLTYANVVSTLCLFIVLGGGAYAAVTLPKNSVGTKQLKKNAVTTKKVKNGTLTVKDAKAGQFATPSQLGGLLPKAGTAANASRLGGIGPNGFLRGVGSVSRSDFQGTSHSGSFVEIAGGGAIDLSCGPSGYAVTFNPPASGGPPAYDLFTTILRDAGPTSVSYALKHPGDGTIGVNSTTNAQFLFDVSSNDGSATVALWAHFDTTSKVCTVKARTIALTFPVL